MNFLDGLILILFAICVVVWPTQLISDGANRGLRIAAILMIAAQLFIDGARWQLVPVYLVAALFLLLLLVNRTHSEEPSRVREAKESATKKIVRWSMVLGSGLAVTASILSCLMFPRP